jgi:hypothetical protein
MSISSSLIIITLAALLHASFQLSISVLTLMSGHAIGAHNPRVKVLGLITSFVFGSGVMTLLLLAFVSFILSSLFNADTSPAFWAISCGLVVGVGIAVWLFYYRHERGTMLWIPRGMARYLSDRSKITKSSSEAFGLGLSSVFGELLFIIAPIIISAIILVQLPSTWQLVGLIIYTIISLSSLLIIWVLIGSGHQLSRIQKWREKNKYFLQFAAGSGLVVLGFFVYANQMMNVVISGGS